MSKLIVIKFIGMMLTFVAVFVGIGLGALGVPAEVAIASGFIVTGVALRVAGMHPRLKQLKERLLPVKLSFVGVYFVGFGVLLLFLFPLVG